MKTNAKNWLGCTFLLMAIFILNGCSFFSPNWQDSEADTILKQSLIASYKPQYRIKVINTFPHNPQAFTEGLVMENGRLYESQGLYHYSKIELFALGARTPLLSKSLSFNYFGEGIAIIKDKLYQLTYREQTGFIYNKRTLQALGSFNYPGEGWGLTTDGRHLIMSNGTPILTYLKPSGFKAIKEVEVTLNGQPLSGLNELIFIDGKIYANVLPTSIVVIISPDSGQVIGWFDIAKLAPGKECDPIRCVANGIAYNEENNTLLVTGKMWPAIHEIKISRMGRVG